MPKIKTTTLLLDDTTDEDVSLIALHCSLEVFRLVYLINHKLKLNLKRKEQDVDFQYKASFSFFPLYHYFDHSENSDFYVMANKSTTKPANVVSQGGLFEEGSSYSTFLVPEQKTVDYFLKIEGSNAPKKFLLKLKEIKQITTAYAVDFSALKSYQNLIFN